MSGPMMLFDLNIEQNGDIKENYFNLDNTIIDNFPLKKLIKKQDIDCLSEEQKQKYNDFKSIDTETISYEDATSLFRIRKKSCGKSRGVVSRKINTVKEHND